MSDADRMTKLLLAALTAYPHSKANEDTILLYVHALNGYSYLQVESAVTKLIRTARFFPTVAEIVHAIESITATAAGVEMITSGDAWYEAIENVKKYHLYKPWKYSCNSVERACKRFGIRELCNIEEKDVGIARAQFMRIFEQEQARERDVAQNKKVLERLSNVDVQEITAGKINLIAG